MHTALSSGFLFVLMVITGNQEERQSKPIGISSSEEDAKRFVERKNAAALRLYGKIEARDLLMRHWWDTHRIESEEPVRSESGEAESLRLTHLLEIQKDLEALGFRSEDDFDYAKWSYTSVPILDQR